MSTRNRLALGWTPPSLPSSVLTQALNTANTWLAFSFTGPSPATTLSKVKAFISAVTAGPVAADATCEIYSDTAGIPGSSIQGPRVADANPAASTWLQWSGFTAALTPETRYWLVIKNANAAPATTFYTVRFGAAGQSIGLRGEQATVAGPGTGGSYGWNKLHTTDGGGTWSTGTAGTFGYRVEYGDGSFDGLPLSNLAAGTTANWVYGARETGVLLVTSANAVLNVAAIAMTVLRVGTPTGLLRYRLYGGATLLGTTVTLAPAVVGTNSPTGYLTLPFATPIVIQPGTTLRVMLSETAQADSVANALRGYEYTVENDANSRALLPFGGIKQTITTDATANPVVFVETDTLCSPFALLLDSTTPFAAPSMIVIRKRRQVR